MGIFDDMDFELSDPYQYFLEHPDSEYLQLKDKVSSYNVIPFKLYGTGNEKESADYVYYHMSTPVMGNLCNFSKNSVDFLIFDTIPFRKTAKRQTYIISLKCRYIPGWNIGKEVCTACLFFCV